MSILSLEFLVLMACLLVVYYCLPVRFRWMGLLAASMVFYASAGWGGLVYLGCVTLITWLAGSYMGKCRAKEKTAAAEGDKIQAYFAKVRRSRWLIVTVVLVISGMAAGIDAEAARGALRAGGALVGVVGNTVFVKLRNTVGIRHGNNG